MVQSLQVYFLLCGTARLAIHPIFISLACLLHLSAWRYLFETPDPPSSEHCPFSLDKVSKFIRMLRKGGKTTAINSGGRKKLHTTYEGGESVS